MDNDSPSNRIPWKRLIAEGVAIVVSILLAFAIDAWWDRKEEHRNLKEYLTAFSHELDENHNEIEITLVKSVEVLEMANQVFFYLSDPVSYELSGDFEKTIGKIYKIHMPRLTTGAYEDMVSSGQMRLIKNSELSSKIKEHQEVVDSVRRVNDLLWDTYYQLQVPFLKDHFIISNFGWESTEEIVDAGGLLRPTPDSPFEYNQKSIKTIEFWNLLYSWKEAYSDQVRQLVDAEKNCEEVRSLLGST